MAELGTGMVLKWAGVPLVEIIRWSETYPIPIMRAGLRQMAAEIIMKATLHITIECADLATLGEIRETPKRVHL